MCLVYVIFVLCFYRVCVCFVLFCSVIFYINNYHERTKVMVGCCNVVVFILFSLQQEKMENGSMARRKAWYMDLLLHISSITQ